MENSQQKAKDPSKNLGFNAVFYSNFHPLLPPGNTVCICMHCFFRCVQLVSVPDIYSNWNELSNWATSTAKCENSSVLQSHATARYSGCEKITSTPRSLHIFNSMYYELTE